MSTKTMNNNGQQIKVKPTTKINLDKLKGSDTYDGIICKMINYFESTGLNPDSKIISPVAAVAEAADRIIKVIRGVEKSTEVTLTGIYNTVKNLSSGSVSASVKNEVSFSPEEMQNINAVIERAEQVERDNARLTDEVKELKNKLEIAEGESRTATGIHARLNVTKVLEILAVLDDKKKPSTFNSTYEIDRTTFDEYMKRLRIELNQ